MAREFRYLADDGYGTLALFEDGAWQAAVQFASPGNNHRRTDDGKYTMGAEGGLTLTVTQALRRECRCRGRCVAGCVMRPAEGGIYQCRLEGDRLLGFPGANQDGAVGPEWVFTEKKLGAAGAAE